MDTAVSVLYLVLAITMWVMAAQFGIDAWRNHYRHKPLRPVVVWVAALFSAQGLMFVGLSTARWYRVMYGVTAPWLFSGWWVLLLVLEVGLMFGLYSALREAK